MATSAPAHARGLVSFPCNQQPLLNVYHLMRAGTNLLEEEDILSTNPLFLTNREAALSEAGVRQVQEAARILEAAKVYPSVIKYSLAASATDSAGIVRDVLHVGQNRLVPEFTFMDPRAVGKWDMMSYQEVFPAIVALDDMEAKKDGTGARPPINDDGTPHETLADQAIRLRQVMSILETQYSGDNILLVFPDGTSPALLTAMMGGIPYNKCHELEFAPGELRLDVTYESALQLLRDKRAARAQGEDDYALLLEKGKKELKKLQSLNLETVVSKKDQIIERERVEAEEQYRAKERARIAKEEREQQARLQRQREVEDSRMRQRGLDPASRSVGDPTYDMFSAMVAGGGLSALVLLAASAGSGGSSGTSVLNATDTSSSPLGSGYNGTRAGDTPFPLTPAPSTANGALYSSMVDEYQDSGSTATMFSAPVSATGSTTPSLFDGPAPVVKSAEERKKEAKQAMQEYLDQDDGADAWLQSIESILEDNEEEVFMDLEFDTSEASETTTSTPTINGRSNALFPDDSVVETTTETARQEDEDD